MPQPPQWLTVVVSVSHPFAVEPSQLPRPGWQAMAVHTPAWQVSPPLQVMPQPPQLAEVVSAVSHPFAADPSQLPRVLLHWIPHMPLLHVAEPPVELHWIPQPPQWLMSVRVLISHPVTGRPSQLARPVEQVKLHDPLLHAGVPPIALHWMPQPPQLLMSVRRLRSQPSRGLLLQSAWPAPQWPWQLEADPQSVPRPLHWAPVWPGVQSTSLGVHSWSTHSLLTQR